MIKSRILRLVAIYGSILFLFLCGIIGMQYYHIDRLGKQNNDLSVQVGQLKTSLEMEIEKAKDAQRRFEEATNIVQDLLVKNSEVQQDYQRATRELNNARTRLKELSLQKPGLVKNIINNAFTDVMQSIFETTDRRETPSGTDASGKSSEAKPSNTDKS